MLFLSTVETRLGYTTSTFSATASTKPDKDDWTCLHFKSIHRIPVNFAYNGKTRLEETIKKYDSKLVVISNIAGFFLDNEVPQEEAQRIYSQIVSYLSNFARKHQIILIATYLPSKAAK
jgi:hypothetical protein